jgi:hypothetical protein
MSTVALSPSAAQLPDLAATISGTIANQDVVEIGLLLPADWATALMDLAKVRQQSVGQILRTFIGRALVENNAIV